MPNVRPLNKKKYGISKHAFGTAYSYCLQYTEWREELGCRTSTVKSPQITGMPGAHNGSDATANLAERRVELRKKMEKVEDTVREAVGDNECLYDLAVPFVDIWSDSMINTITSGTLCNGQPHLSHEGKLRYAALVENALNYYY